MTPDNSGMPPLPRQDVLYEEHGDSFEAYSGEAMLAYGHQVAQMCAEICEGEKLSVVNESVRGHAYNDAIADCVRSIARRFCL
jgi:hypothetical protein